MNDQSALTGGLTGERVDELDLPGITRHGPLRCADDACIVQNSFPTGPALGTDDNREGLPNWLEMYWFGKFSDWSTATVADADADPDGDGQTNLQEYLAQLDPTKPASALPGSSVPKAPR